MKMFRILSIITGIMILSACATSPADKTDAAVKNGSEVKIHYTLSIEGKAVGSSKEPVSITVGKGMLTQGVDNALIGMSEGEKKTFTVSPAQGYGEFNPNAFQEISRESLKVDMDLKPGMALLFPTSEGKQLRGWVKEVKDESIIVNFNHPFAGRQLDFEVEVVEIL